MVSMFVIWIVVFIGIFYQRRWVIPLSLVAIVWTVVLLRFHMTSALTLSF